MKKKKGYTENLDNTHQKKERKIKGRKGATLALSGAAMERVGGQFSSVSSYEYCDSDDATVHGGFWTQRTWE